MVVQEVQLGWRENLHEVPDNSSTTAYSVECRVVNHDVAPETVGSDEAVEVEEVVLELRVLEIQEITLPELSK